MLAGAQMDGGVVMKKYVEEINQIKNIRAKEIDALLEKMSEELGVHVIDADGVRVHIDDKSWVAAKDGTKVAPRDSDFYPWMISAMIDGLEYFALMTDTEYQELTGCGDG